MTATLNDVAAMNKRAELSAEQQAAAEVVRRAEEAGTVFARAGWVTQVADEDAALTVPPELGRCGHDAVEFSRRQRNPGWRIR
jgi:hypothetical protein